LKNSLPNKVVLITGASNGIGESLAHAFYLAGCRVVLAARRISELERVKKDLLETHSMSVTHPPTIIQMDCADINSLADKVKQVIDIHGQIDILVNNAGISFFGAIVDTTFEAQLKVFMTNYFGLSALTRAVLPSMMKRKDGRIVCISSVLGKFSAPYREPYTSTKHAVQVEK
jgi:dehydrogenase/reductase SDR family protein 7B